MNSKTMNSTFTIKVICAILFVLFSFGYLYCYQADLMAVAQHVLSDGKTHYDKMIGAVLITGVLWGLQLAIQSWIMVPKRFYAVTYFPSLLILTILTDISPDIDIKFSFGAWVWCFPLVIVCYGVVVWLLHGLRQMEGRMEKRTLFGNLWPNFLLFFFMFILVDMVANHNEVFHYRMRMEQKIAVNDFKGAAEVGSRSLQTDSSLTMLRIYALSKQGRLGEELFEYPLVGRSDAMLPNGTSVRMMSVSEGKLYRHLGVWIREKLSIYPYLTFLKSRRRDTKAAHDYELCAYLLDKKLYDFARALRKYYPIDERLPKHYKEALTLINHKVSAAGLGYHEDVMETNFTDFRAMGRKYAKSEERYAALADAYGATYWFYYLYR